MSPDDIEQITQLVALQLKAAAAEQEELRATTYRMVIGLSKAVEELSGRVGDATAANIRNTSKILEEFARQFIATVVPVIAERVAATGSSKADPAMNEKVAEAIFLGTKSLVDRTVTPLVQRLESLEQRLPRDR